MLRHARSHVILNIHFGCRIHVILMKSRVAEVSPMFSRNVLISTPKILSLRGTRTLTQPCLSHQLSQHYHLMRYGVHLLPPMRWWTEFHTHHTRRETNLGGWQTGLLREKTAEMDEVEGSSTIETTEVDIFGMIIRLSIY